MGSLVRLIAGKFRSGLIQRTFVYTASASLNSLIAFFLLPVMTRYLSPYDYGVVETYLAVTACLTGIVIVGGNALLSKEYFILKPEERDNFISNILGVIFIAGLLIFAFVSLTDSVTGYFPNLFKMNNALIMLAIITSFTNAIIALLFTLLQLEKKPGLYAYFVNSKTIVEIAISLFCIIVLGMNWQGRITGIVATAVLFSLAAMALFRSRNIKPALPARYGRTIVYLGVPLIIAHITGWTNEMISKVMITNMINVESTGLYSIGYRFGMVITMVGTSFSLAWLPFFYENIKENSMELNRKIVKATYLYIAGLFLLAFVFGLFGKHLLYIMVDKKFYAASQFIFLISMAYCFDGIWKMFIGYLIYHGKTKIYSNIVLASAIINIALNYLLIKRMGLIGSAWATFLSFGAGAIMTVFAGSRIHPMPWISFSKQRLN